MRMKTIHLFAFLSLLFLSCGGNREAAEQMERAETLLVSTPDSAYALLEAVELPDKLNERQFARWCMLYCRAADKLYKEMAYAEQLERALSWYNRHGSVEEQAWIGLYLAFVCGGQTVCCGDKSLFESIGLGKGKTSI